MVKNKIKITANMFSASSGMPPQMVSMEEKGQDPWMHACMDFLDYQSNAQSREKMDDLRKYRILSGDFDIKDYSYVSDPLSIITPRQDTNDPGNPSPMNDGLNERIQHYPIMVRPINTIIGEYISRISQLHGFYAKNESPRARNEYNRTKTEMMQEWATQQVMKAVYRKVEQMGIQKNTEQYQQAVEQNTPEDIQDYMDRDYTDVAEKVCQTLLKGIWKTEGLDTEFVEGFKRACIVAKEFYHIYSVNKRTKVKNVSDIDVFYHKSPSVRWVSEGQYAGFRQYLTPSAIIDMFYDVLTISDLETIQAAISSGVASKTPAATSSVAYDTKTFSTPQGDLSMMENKAMWGMIDEFQRYGTSYTSSTTMGLIKVVRGYWKSVRKIGWLTTYDPGTDKPVVEMVDENYKPNKALGEHVEFTPCNQVYTGAKILDSIYLDIGPYQDQIIDMDDLQYAPLPIEGCTYNDTNSKPYSLIDLMTPWNELYNIAAHELKEILNSGIGKVLFMSIDHIPNTPGFDQKKWLYWVRKFKIAWVKQPKTGPNTFNQFSAADMSMFQTVQAIMDMLERLKQECDSIAGFSAGRVAAQSQDQTLGQSNQTLNSSINQTEYMFFRHSKLIERVLNQALNLTKNNLKDKTYIRNLFDDYEQAYIDFEPDQVRNEKVGIYITNAGEDQRKRAAMQQLMQPAMQNGADFMDLSEMIMAETMGEVRQLGNKLRRQAKAARSADMKYKQDQLAQEMQIHKEEMAQVKQIADDRNASAEEQAYIKTFGGRNASPEDDADNNGIPDVVEFAKYSQKERELMKKFMIQEKSLDQKEKERKDKMKMHDDEMKAEKERTAVMRNKQSSK